MKVSLFDEKNKGLYFIFPNCLTFLKTGIYLL